MNCAQIQQDLQLYMDGRLDQRRLPAVEAHLDHCYRCRHDAFLYQIMQEALSDQQLEPEPPDLTTLVMGRIAQASLQRSRAGAQPFGWRWRDALLAAVLGTASTMLFMLVNPSLSASFVMNISHAFPLLVLLTSAKGPASIPWVAWIIWISVGVVLTIWLPGAEVRAAWKRSLSERLQARLQFPQLW